MEIQQIGISIAGERVDMEREGVSFTVTARRDGREWVYEGVASESALAMLGTGDSMSIFRANITKFLEGAVKGWREQPTTWHFVINSATVNEGGGFVSID